MPVVETIGGLIGVAIFCSVVVRRARIKKRQHKANKLTKALWKRRKFVYGSPQVLPSPSRTSVSSAGAEQTVANVNYYPSASAVVTPNIIMPPIHRNDDLYNPYSSEVPNATISTILAQKTVCHNNIIQSDNSLVSERTNDVELQDLGLPSSPSPLLYQETPSAPNLDLSEIVETEYPEVPISSTSSQEPSAPTLDDF